MAFLPTKTTASGSVAIQIDPFSTGVDAFGRGRVSAPFTIFDCQHHRDKQPLLFDEALVGASPATWNADQHCVDMTLGSGGPANGDSIVRQTYQYHRYQPGKSQLVFCTGVLGEPKTNVRKRMGYFDANNGLFLEVGETDVAVVRRSATTGSVVDTSIPRASWNIDRLDGTGPSGVNLDFDKAQILVIDIEWLGVGAVRWGFAVGGVIYAAHKQDNANVVTEPYMQTACLPIRYEIENTGVAATPTTLKQICCSVQSEGGFNPLGIPRSASTRNSGVTTVIGTYVPLCSIRLAAADNRNQIKPEYFTFATSGNQEYLVRLTLRPTTLTGATWADSTGANGITEIDAAATAVSGGEILYEVAAAQDTTILVPFGDIIRLGASIAGAADILTLSTLQRAGAGSNCFASIGFTELY